MIKITAELDSVTFKRAWVVGGRYYNPPEYELFKETLGHLAKIAMHGRLPVECPVKVAIKMYRELPPWYQQYGDVDNHLKAILDSLNGIVYKDDRQVVEARITAYRGSPRIEIEVREIKCGSSKKPARGAGRNSGR